MAKAKAKAHLKAVAKGDGKDDTARKLSQALRSRVRGQSKQQTHQACNDSDNWVMRMRSSLTQEVKCKRFNCAKGELSYFVVYRSLLYTLYFLDIKHNDIVLRYAKGGFNIRVFFFF